jgi:hypothetical protein
VRNSESCEVAIEYRCKYLQVNGLRIVFGQTLLSMPNLTISCLDLHGSLISKWICRLGIAIDVKFAHLKELALIWDLATFGRPLG